MSKITPSNNIEQDIQTLKQRFFRANKGRYERCLEQLTFKQQTVLEIIPMLFHINDVLLPGYINDDVPCGFHGFKPKESQFERLKSFNRNFKYTAKYNQEGDLSSVFIMGSCGSIAQNSQSDLDFWLVHKHDLNTARIFALEKKAQLIESWAATFNLETHFFLMSAEDFKNKKVGKLTSEHSGSAQHLLLLDEFYRSCILLVGSYPIWWLVPCENELQYESFIQAIYDKGVLNYRETIDFGSTMPLAIEELYGASVWQLCKAIDSPYKSIVKTVLLEYYVQNKSENTLLSQEFKYRIHHNTVNLNQIDAYLLLYNMVEGYLLATNQATRLTIFRKSIYLKLNLKLSQTLAKTKSWRRTVISALVDNWDWSEQQIQHLDNRTQWSIRTTLKEKNEILNELSYCHRLLSNKCQKQQIKLSQTDLNILSRKLYSVFDKKHEKIDLINPGICKELSHCNIYIYEVKTKKTKQSIWSVYEHPIDINSEKSPIPIKRSFSLVEIWLWLYMNGLFVENKHIGFSSQSQQITQQKQFQLFHIFDQCLLPFSQKNNHEYFEYNAEIERSAILVNTLNEPLEALSKKGLHKLSPLNDSLNYSKEHDNLIESVDIIFQNSWNETFIYHFEGDKSLGLVLQLYLNTIKSAKKWIEPAINIGCITQNQFIYNRVDSLISQIKDRCIDHSCTQFIYNVRSNFIILSKINDIFFIEQCKNESFVLDYLSQNSIDITKVSFEQQCQKNSLIYTLINAHKNNSISIFIENDSNNNRQDIYIIDEANHILHFNETHTHLTTLVKSCDQFIYHSRSQRSHRVPTQYYLIIKDKNNINLKPLTIRDDMLLAQAFDVNIFLDKDIHQKLIYNIEINEQSFHSFDYADKIFLKAAQYLLSLRSGQENYWIYINKLSLSDTMNHANDSSVYFFKHKISIEDRLNKAISMALH
ncbi:MAG: class I adenylate cyclase [Saccharospirillaceae bacterium]|nr:class I adenylate cyclase [Pseudomonadales bacterium]NRB80491.1 class I adenylate cyclase [Saccharospirillaceae bacterium]